MSAEAVSLPLVFFAGVVSFASPCFLPVAPVFVASLSETKLSPRFSPAAGERFIGCLHRAAAPPSEGTRESMSRARSGQCHRFCCRFLFGVCVHLAAHRHRRVGGGGLSQHAAGGGWGPADPYGTGCRWAAAH